MAAVAAEAAGIERRIAARDCTRRRGYLDISGIGSRFDVGRAAVPGSSASAEARECATAPPDRADLVRRPECDRPGHCRNTGPAGVSVSACLAIATRAVGGQLCVTIEGDRAASVERLIGRDRYGSAKSHASLRDVGNAFAG